MLNRTLAVCAALTLALAGCGADDTGGENAADAGAATTSAAGDAGGAGDAEGDTAEGDGPESADAVSFTVKGGERVDGPERIEVGVGETVAIDVTSDTADELHVHGYNETVALTPGEPATLEFEAAIAGVWEIELHDSGSLLTELRVTG